MASKASALRFLYATLTQGSADAFIQANMATALSGQTKTAYRVREILIEWGVAGSSQGQGVFNGGVWELCLTRKTQAAMPVITDKSVIAKFKRASAITTSGASILDTISRYVYSEDDDLIIVEDPVYWQLDTAGTALTNVAQVRVGYQEVSISEVDRLTLITNSLQ